MEAGAFADGENVVAQRASSEFHMYYGHRVWARWAQPLDISGRQSHYDQLPLRMPPITAGIEISQ